MASFSYDSMVLLPNMSPINNSSNSFSQIYGDPLVTDGNHFQTGDEQVTQNVDKKRKIGNGTAFDSAQSSDKGKGRKQKKSNDWMENEKKYGEDSPKGYIHVRARRGQATDSHSLAERVRREKINERMKILQCLVPGCDKVTGKADKLDEIINYVQSLQNQVEFLSMELSSIGPMFYDFEADLEAFMMKSEDNAGLLWDLGSFH